MSIYQVDYNEKAKIADLISTGKKEEALDLVKKGCSPFEFLMGRGTAFNVAAQEGDFETLSSLIDLSKDDPRLTEALELALCSAACSPWLNIEAVSFLISIGVNSNAEAVRSSSPFSVEPPLLRTMNWWSKLGEEERRRSLNCAKLLIDAGADINKEALHEAARQNIDSMVELLIKEGVQINGLDSFKKTPLDIAVEHDSSDVALLLLNSGADPIPYAANEDGKKVPAWEIEESTETAALVKAWIERNELAIGIAVGSSPARKRQI